MHLENHPAADIFPMMTGSDFAALKDDIAANGQKEWIVLFEGKILDGRNRYRACQELGIEPELSELDDCKDPIAYVLSLNLHRRHLTEGQRAAVAARIANLSNGQKASSANLQSSPVTQSQAAEILNVSPRSVADAKKVHDHGCDALVEQMERGAIAPSLAAKFVDAVPDKKQQAKDVEKGKPAVQEAVREAAPKKSTQKKKAEPAAEASKPGESQFVKEFLSLWSRCDDVAKAAIRAIVLESTP